MMPSNVECVGVSISKGFSKNVVAMINKLLGLFLDAFGHRILVPAYGKLLGLPGGASVVRHFPGGSGGQLGRNRSVADFIV